MSRLLETIAKRLSDGGYRVERSVQLQDTTTADVTASRTYFSWKGLMILSQHILIKEVESADGSVFSSLFAAGFRFAKKRNRIPLLRGIQFGYMILPVIVTTNPQADLVGYATTIPRRRWSLFEFPVVVNANTGRADYFRGTPLWGAFLFADMRAIVEKFIEHGLWLEAHP